MPSFLVEHESSTLTQHLVSPKIFAGQINLAGAC
jgi:hypothetical protein